MDNWRKAQIAALGEEHQRTVVANSHRFMDKTEAAWAELCLAATPDESQRAAGYMAGEMDRGPIPDDPSYAAGWFKGRCDNLYRSVSANVSCAFPPLTDERRAEYETAILEEEPDLLDTPLSAIPFSCRIHSTGSGPFISTIALAMTQETLRMKAWLALDAYVHRHPHRAFEIVEDVPMVRYDPQVAKGSPYRNATVSA